MTNPTHLELVNVSVRMYQIHKDLIEKAAAMVPGRTPSDYIREVLAMQAALDLNIELPHTPDINRGRAGGLVNQAAQKLGMSREDFEQLAIKHMAAQTLESNALVTPPQGVPAVRPGSYHEEALASERPSRGPRAHSETRALNPSAMRKAGR
jgi:uncharacterized protein (DUF1778 family)